MIVALNAQFLGSWQALHAPLLCVLWGKDSDNMP